MPGLPPALLRGVTIPLRVAFGIALRVELHLDPGVVVALLSKSLPQLAKAAAQHLGSLRVLGDELYVELTLPELDTHLQLTELLGRKAQGGDGTSTRLGQMDHLCDPLPARRSMAGRRAGDRAV